ncbi:hypothetical protein C8R45DRAFT_75219 [Mycena sanguinolenta]|nr:hypothetical protein C8R45DRAFT_75219 [Mycena sanguinolenta]
MTQDRKVFCSTLVTATLPAPVLCGLILNKLAIFGRQLGANHVSVNLQNGAVFFVCQWNKRMPPAAEMCVW